MMLGKNKWSICVFKWARKENEQWMSYSCSHAPKGLDLEKNDFDYQKDRNWWSIEKIKKMRVYLRVWRGERKRRESGHTFDDGCL